MQPSIFFAFGLSQRLSGMHGSNHNDEYHSSTVTSTTRLKCSTSLMMPAPNSKVFAAPHATASVNACTTTPASAAAAVIDVLSPALTAPCSPAMKPATNASPEPTVETGLGTFS